MRDKGNHRPLLFLLVHRCWENVNYQQCNYRTLTEFHQTRPALANGQAGLILALFTILPFAAWGVRVFKVKCHGSDESL